MKKDLQGKRDWFILMVHRKAAKNAEKSIKTNKRKYVEDAVTKILYWNQKYVD